MGVLKIQNIRWQICQNSYYILPNAFFCILIVTNDLWRLQKMEERKIKKCFKPNWNENQDKELVLRSAHYLELQQCNVLWDYRWNRDFISTTIWNSSERSLERSLAWSELPPSVRDDSPLIARSVCLRASAFKVAADKVVARGTGTPRVQRILP